MKLLFDTNGGDNAPLAIINGAIQASKELDVEIVLLGREKEIQKTLGALDYDPSKVEIISAEEKIENDEEPAFAIRKKKNSSIVLGLKALKEGRGDAFISAGSTGALLAGGLFIVGRIKGLKRGVLPTSLPGIHSETMVIDSGANMDCDSELILQFARLGSLYLKAYKGIENPKVGLLNVGSEPGKGNTLAKECYEILSRSEVNFIGNVEGGQIPTTDADLVVCDGFDGNILLKSVEGTASFLMGGLSKRIKDSDLDSNHKLVMAEIIRDFSKNLDASEVGGTLLLGLQDLVVKAHGNSNEKAIKNAAKFAVDILEKRVIDEIRDNFSE